MNHLVNCVQTLDEIRLDLLARHPDALWLPGDEPPIGQRVIDEAGRFGAVAGEDAPRPPHHCATCTCPAEPHRSYGLWIVEREGEAMPFPYSGPLRTYENPVSLRPVDGAGNAVRWPPEHENNGGAK